jgi:hypothetical protein
VFLYDTLMMVAEATETCRRRVMYGKTYFIDVRLLVCYTTYILFNVHIWNILITYKLI